MNSGAQTDIETASGNYSHRRLDIQGLRALAVIVVIAFHAGLPVPGGFVGVDVFFVISGFVITALLHREWLETGRIRFGRFYKRRFLRLTPALAVLVSVTMFVSIFLLSPFGTQQNAAQTGTGAMLLFANFAIVFNSGGYFSPNAAENPLLNTWSLSVEEQFYLVFPIVLLLAWWLGARIKRSMSVSVLIVLLGALVSFGLAVLAASGWSPKAGAALISFYSPVTRAWEFAAGALLLLLTRKLSRSRPHPYVATGSAVAGVLLLIVSILVITQATPFPGLWTLLPVVAALLLLLAGELAINPISRFLSSRPLTYVGDRSYSLYLWHWPFIVFSLILCPDNHLAVLVAALASIPVALASFALVEQPLRQRRHIRGLKLWGLVAIVIVPPLVLSQLLGFGARNLWNSDRVRSAVDARSASGQALHVECVADASIGGNNLADLEACTLNGSTSGAPIYIVGDSNSVIYSDALLEAAVDSGRPIILRAAALCPFIDIMRITEHGAAADQACQDFYASTMNEIKDGKPGTVVIAESSGYWYESNLRIEPGATGNTLSDPNRAQKIENGLTSTIKELLSDGNQVVLVTPNYQFDHGVSLEQCTNIGLTSGACPAPRAESEAMPGQVEAKSSVKAVGAKLGVEVIDVSDLQCPDSSCGPTSNGMPTYVDASHMSPSLLALAGPRFAKALTANSASR
ncbi:MAG: acyltransferase family protein [Actinomycetes bacterium]